MGVHYPGPSRRPPLGLLFSDAKQDVTGTRGATVQPGRGGRTSQGPRRPGQRGGASACHQPVIPVTAEDSQGSRDSPTGQGHLPQVWGSLPHGGLAGLCLWSRWG